MLLAYLPPSLRGALTAVLSSVQVPLRMSVDQISFSAHADYAQTEGFIKALQPAHVVRVCLCLPSARRVHGTGRNLSAASPHCRCSSCLADGLLGTAVVPMRTVC